MNGNAALMVSATATSMYRWGGAGADAAQSESSSTTPRRAQRRSSAASSPIVERGVGSRQFSVVTASIWEMASREKLVRVFVESGQVRKLTLRPSAPCCRGARRAKP